MPDIQKKLLCRVTDANFNRAREGLRVCEEFTRFFLDDRGLTKALKKARSDISRIYTGLSHNTRKALFSARDTASDVGRAGFPFEKKKEKPVDIYWASLQRSKEALRVLEEFAKLGGPGSRSSDDFKKMRFKLYDIEKQSFKRLQKLK
ncbi:MAG: thiamine-phosphate pyrophosphorylase [Candidatus Omnitrophica bacterium]|nr:thiamine-phosphate pyrophosphorylase [Candidatus Omnitrophota bacterium]